jgi:hypothetical protein
MTSARSHRSYTYDPTRLVIKWLWPLCFFDMIAWGWYVGGGIGKLGVAFYFLVLMASIVYLRKT